MNSRTTKSVWNMMDHMKHMDHGVLTQQKIVCISLSFLSISLNFTFYTFSYLKIANEVTCDEEEGHISYHPDKADCTHYYMCEGERKHHMPCPANLVFNPSENVCDWPENVESCQHHTQAPPTSK